MEVANGLGLQPLRDVISLPDEAPNLFSGLATALNLTRIAQGVPKPANIMVARLQSPTLGTEGLGELIKPSLDLGSDPQTMP
jgi:hypothetical protein